MKTEFVGRDCEVALLRSLFEACAEHSGDQSSSGPKMLLLIGESGLGKTRLVQELYVQLAKDENWNPENTSYWPASFGDDGVRLRTVPDMRGQEPKAPPRFVWLGSRWQATNVRNPEERRSVLPDLLSAVMSHVAIVEKFRPLWREAARRLTVAVQEMTVDEIASALLENIPLGGLIYKLAKGTGDMAVDRISGPRSYEGQEQVRHQTVRDELNECMRGLLSGGVAVPTVLWLDDAQWIDSEGERFLSQLWNEATRQGWPLFVVATHWEREWRELDKVPITQGSQSLHVFVDQPGVHVLFLEAPEPLVLRQTVTGNLPGLTPQQVQLLAIKAGGNFLSMVENVSELLAQPRWFIGANIENQLSDAAIDHIRDFETDRSRRVAQRFAQFEVEVQDVLGWSSILGMRFLRDVIVEVATAKLQRTDAKQVVERCEDPYVVLGAASDLILEFRDRAFFEIASDFGCKFLSQDSEDVRSVLRNHLLRWIEKSFDLQCSSPWWLMYSSNARSTGQNFGSLEYSERHDLLDVAAREFPLSASTAIDWRLNENIAALSVIIIAIGSDSTAQNWQQSGAHLRSLENIDWSSVPTDVLPETERWRVAEAAITAGARGVARGLAQDILDRARQSLDKDCIPHCADVHEVLLLVAAQEVSDGNHRAARAHIEEALKILSDQHEGHFFPAARKRFNVLFRLGQVEQALGENSSAQLRYEECVSIARALADHDGIGPLTLEQMAASSMALTSVSVILGDLDAALEWSEVAIGASRELLQLPNSLDNGDLLSRSLLLKIQIQLAKNDTEDLLSSFPEVWNLVSDRYHDTGSIKALLLLIAVEHTGAQVLLAQGRTEDSLAIYRESLTTIRSVEDGIVDADILRFEVSCLQAIALAHKASGDFCSMRSAFSEGICIARQHASSDDSLLSQLLYVGLLSVAFHAYDELEDYDNAIVTGEEAVVAYGHLTDERRPDNDVWVDFSGVLRRLVYIYLSQGLVDSVAGRIFTILQRARMASDESSHHDVVFHLAHCLMLAGLCKYELNDQLAARQMHDESIQLLHGIVGDGGRVEYVDCLVQTLYVVSTVSWELGEETAAVKYLADLVSVFEMAAEIRASNSTSWLLNPTESLLTHVKSLAEGADSPQLKERLQFIEQQLLSFFPAPE